MRARKIILNLVSKNCTFSREWYSKSRKMRMDEERIFGITKLKLQAFNLAALKMILRDIAVKVSRWWRGPVCKSHGAWSQIFVNKKSKKFYFSRAAGWIWCEDFECKFKNLSYRHFSHFSSWKTTFQWLNAMVSEAIFPTNWGYMSIERWS